MCHWHQRAASASLGVDIYDLAPGRAEDPDFSLLPRTTSVNRWRNISRKKVAIGLVFVTIVLVIGLIIGTLARQPPSAPEVDDLCIIYPNGITANDDFVPNACSRISVTCLELITHPWKTNLGLKRALHSAAYTRLIPAPQPLFPPLRRISMSWHKKIQKKHQQ